MIVNVTINKIEYVEKDSELVIKIYARTDDNKKVCLVDSFMDYFFVDISSGKLDEIYEISGDVEISKSDFEISDQKSSLVKVKASTTKKTKEMVDSLIEAGYDCYEHDVPLIKKYLIEKNLRYDKIYRVIFDDVITKEKVDFYGKITQINEKDLNEIDLKCLFFDIETFDDGEGINFEKNPILMISIVCGNYKKTLISKNYKYPDVESFDNEEQMLIKFKEILSELKPDLIAGYNIKSFDIPYIITRFKKYNISCDLGVNNSEVNELRTKEKFDIFGINLFDIFLLIKNIFRNTIQGNYSLDNVSNYLLGKSKDNVDFKEMSEEWTEKKLSESFSKYIDYCLKDTILCEELFSFFRNDIEEFISMLNVNLDELTSLSFSQVVEQYLIQNAHNYNQVILPKPGEEDIKERSQKRIKGAFVFDPKPGFYENIAVYDFTSLYPTIIESYNITKGTVIADSLANSIKVPEKDFYIRQEKKAFIPLVIKEIISKRIQLKSELKSENDKEIIKSKKSKLETLKIIANSLYGYLAFYMARWYSFEAAESVTSFGRFNIKKVISEFEKNNLKVIYSDTDSIFVIYDENKTDQLIKKINSELPGMMNLEKEGVFKSGIFIMQRGISEKGAKKRYALLSFEDKLKVAGLEMVRGDWSLVAKSIQKKVLQLVLSEGNCNNALEYVKEECSSLNERLIDDFVITTKLTKNVSEYASNGPHVVIAKKMIENNINVGPGTLIGYVITKNESNRIGDKAKLPEETNISEVDFEYYKNNQILPALEGIFFVFNIDVKEHIQRKNSKLDSFF